MEPRLDSTNNPFIGLRAFSSNHAADFKGRDELIQQGLEKLKRKADANSPFLLLLGKHGAGKTSLLQAGIIPALNSSELFANITSFYSSVIHPCDLSIDPIRALVHCLSLIEPLQLVPDNEVSAHTKLCKEQPEVFLQRLQVQLDLLADDQRIVLGVCQLERLFMSDSVGLANRRLFLDILHRLASHCGVFVIASLRSDYYHSLSDYPSLLELKQSGGQLDVLPPSTEQIRQMIYADDQHKNLQFEQAKSSSPSLDEYLVQRIYAYPDSLPLMQFLMQQLYVHRSQNGLLNTATYKKLGGIERAIAKVTEQTYESLERSAKRNFSRTVNRLAVKGVNGKYERLWVNVVELQKSANAKQLIDRYTSLGVFTQYQACDGATYLALTHDCLFEQWPRLLETLEAYQEINALKQLLEQQASDWKSATRPSLYLLSSGKALEEGQRILKYGGSISPKLKAFIDASSKRAELKRRLWVGGSIVVVMLFGFALNNAYQAKVGQQQAEQKLVKSHQLIEYLIAEESKQLSKIDRLDLMRDGSQRSMEYLSSVAPYDDSTAAMLSRSRAFYQIGKVYLQNQDYQGAISAFEYTLALDNELVDIHPNGFDYMLELAKVQFAIASTYLKAGDNEKADQYFLAYQKTAFDLVDLQPDSAVAKLELSRAYAQLAQVAEQRGQTETATQHFFEAVKFAEKSRTVASLEDLLQTARAYQWLEQKYQADLKLAEAIEMNKGESRIWQLILTQSQNPEHQLAFADSQWRLANNLLLVGQHKQASNTLDDLLGLSQSKLEQADAADEWLYLQAFSLSQLGQLALHGNNAKQAQTLFQTSFAKLEALGEDASPAWSAAFFERQYWYARLLHGLQQEQAYAAAAELISSSKEPQAQLWSTRLQTLQAADLQELRLDSSEPLSPHHVIAYIERASKLDSLEILDSLWQRVPQEMWQQADLEALRPTIRQQLKQNPAE